MWISRILSAGQAALSKIYPQVKKNPRTNPQFFMHYMKKDWGKPFISGIMQGFLDAFSDFK
jgi:hypothetical protein